MILTQLTRRIRAFKTDLKVLLLALIDGRTPWRSRLVLLAALIYAISPVDLLPDLVPLAGYLDDLVVVPLAIMLSLRLIPREVVADSRRRANAVQISGKKLGLGCAGILVAVWILMVLSIVVLLADLIGG